MASVEALPSDATPNDSSKLRAANTIPWQEGSEPFISTADARRILTQD